MLVFLLQVLFRINKRSVRPDHSNRQCHSIVKCSKTEVRYYSFEISSSFDSTPGCSINGSKQACKVKASDAIHRYAMERQASEVHILGSTIHDILKNNTNVLNKGMQYSACYLL